MAILCPSFVTCTIGGLVDIAAFFATPAILILFRTIFSTFFWFVFSRLLSVAISGPIIIVSRINGVPAATAFLTVPAALMFFFIKLSTFFFAGSFLGRIGLMCSMYNLPLMSVENRLFSVTKWRSASNFTTVK